MRVESVVNDVVDIHDDETKALQPWSERATCISAGASKAGSTRNTTVRVSVSSLTAVAATMTDPFLCLLVC